MNKLLRGLSTLMIIIGFLFLLVYISSQNTESISILSHPSYYTEQSLWMVFVAGIAVLLFSVLGSFFSWSRKLDKPKEEALLNPGYVSAEEIHSWVAGSTADSGRKEDSELKNRATQEAENQKKRVAEDPKAASLTEQITDLSEGESNYGQTEIIGEEESRT